MSNRRHLKSAKSRRAPADPADFVEEADLPRERRSFWGWVATSLKVTLGVGLILGAVTGISWGVFRYAKTTPRFSVKTIQVEGTKRLSRDDILAAAGISAGENLFSIDVESAQMALIRSPWIERARVTRRLPDSISIEVHEREARATLVVQGKSLLLDENGVPFKQVGLGDPHDLPLITGVSLHSLRKNRSIEHERLRDVLSLVRSYEHMALAKRFPAEEVHLEDSGHATLIVGSSGTSLHLGPPPYKQRLMRAERVLNKTLRSGVTPGVVFLDNEAHPERVVVRLK